MPDRASRPPRTGGRPRAEAAGVDRPRRALVLGGGGVLGFAWTLGALSAVESVLGPAALQADLAVGTSAGAVIAGMLGCGLPVEVMCRHHQGVPLPEDPVIGYDYDGIGSALPPRPGLRPAAPRLLVDGLLHPRRVAPLVALSGLLPAGRGSLTPIRELLTAVTADAGFATGWPDRPRPWVVAVDHARGGRVVFGRAGSPAATLAQAVTASCSIPGWYAPCVIDGVPYVDGGVASNASVDVLLGAPVDEVLVLAPMGGRGREQPRRLQPPRLQPRSAMQRADAMVRRRVTRTIERDVTALRAQGVRVRVLMPGTEDLAAMGVNLMDPRTRGDVLDVASRSVAARLRAQSQPSTVKGLG